MGVSGLGFRGLGGSFKFWAFFLASRLGLKVQHEATFHGNPSAMKGTLCHVQEGDPNTERASRGVAGLCSGCWSLGLRAGRALVDGCFWYLGIQGRGMGICVCGLTVSFNKHPICKH